MFPVLVGVGLLLRFHNRIISSILCFLGFTYFSDSSKYYQVIGLKALYSSGDYSLYVIYIDDEPNYSPMQERLLEDELVNSIGIASTKY